MATMAATNVALGTNTNAQAILEETRTSSGGTILTKNYYCLGGVDRPGKSGWVTITVTDSAATQAAAVLAGLA
jgi:hypothetical protein